MKTIGRFSIGVICIFATYGAVSIGVYVGNTIRNAMHHTPPVQQVDTVKYEPLTPVIQFYRSRWKSEDVQMLATPGYYRFIIVSDTASLDSIAGGAE